MEKTVLFRDFEERDVDFVFHCKNNEKLSEQTVGPYHPLTYEEAEEWVHGCMGEHDSFKFWAVCTNDEEKRIVGWTALAKIDKVNQSAYTYSIVIGDPDYNDGYAWIETALFLLEYSFEELGMNRVYGESLMGHSASNLIESLLFMTREGVFRQAVYKNGHFYDISYAAILKNEYFAHKNAGDYELPKIIRRLKQLRKTSR